MILGLTSLPPRSSEKDFAKKCRLYRSTRPKKVLKKVLKNMFDVIFHSYFFSCCLYPSTLQKARKFNFKFPLNISQNTNPSRLGETSGEKYSKFAPLTDQQNKLP